MHFFLSLESTTYYYYFYDSLFKLLYFSFQLVRQTSKVFKLLYFSFQLVRQSFQTPLFFFPLVRQTSKVFGRRCSNLITTQNAAALTAWRWIFLSMMLNMSMAYPNMLVNSRCHLLGKDINTHARMHAQYHAAQRL